MPMKKIEPAVTIFSRPFSILKRGRKEGIARIKKSVVTFAVSGVLAIRVSDMV